MRESRSRCLVAARTPSRNRRGWSRSNATAQNWCPHRQVAPKPKWREEARMLTSREYARPQEPGNEIKMFLPFPDIFWWNKGHFNSVTRFVRDSSVALWRIPPSPPQGICVLTSQLNGDVHIFCCAKFTSGRWSPNKLPPPPPPPITPPLPKGSVFSPAPAQWWCSHLLLRPVHFRPLIAKQTPPSPPPSPHPPQGVCVLTCPSSMVMFTSFAAPSSLPVTDRHPTPLSLINRSRISVRLSHAEHGTETNHSTFIPSGSKTRIWLSHPSLASLREPRRFGKGRFFAFFVFFLRRVKSYFFNMLLVKLASRFRTALSAFDD